jgi:hypothetical protein
MLLYLALGLATLGLLLYLARWYATASPSDLSQALRTFIAVFSGLASTGLIFFGRFGLAIITIAATFMAVRSLVRAGRGADPLDDGTAGQSSSVETRLLRMQLDHGTGQLDGEVLIGGFAGRRLSELGLGDLLELLERARLEDPKSEVLIEAYLDRRYAEWREPREGERPARSAAGAMDAATARAVLGVDEHATVEQIKAAHRRLMAKLHPDHGGSDFFASQLNQARDTLLRGQE